MMAYEPLTLLVAVGFYLTTGSFQVSDIIQRRYKRGCLDAGASGRIYVYGGNQVPEIAF